MPLRPLDWFSAPGTEIPVFLDDAPFAGAALVLIALYFPWSLNLAATPRAVTHEWHQWFPTALTSAFGQIALI